MQLVQLKWDLIAFPEIYWPRHMMVIYVYGIYVKARAQFNTLLHICRGNIWQIVIIVFIIPILRLTFQLEWYRIHGINWSHKQETHLTTASQDGTVKYFCINNPRRAEKIITTSSPVWRARYTVSRLFILPKIEYNVTRLWIFCPFV